jgi:hypothetical protein
MHSWNYFVMGILLTLMAYFNPFAGIGSQESARSIAEYLSQAEPGQSVEKLLRSNASFVL